MRNVFGNSVLILAMGCCPAAAADDPDSDPLAAVFRPELRSAVATVLDTHRDQRKYTDSQFPMSPDGFARFRRDTRGRLIEALRLKDWVVAPEPGQASPLAARFHDRRLKTITQQGVTMELHVVEIVETGDRVPMVICLPNGRGRRPGICCFSGHTGHGLRDLVLDLNSYQRGIAVRLARAGFVSIAVEKIDTGYLSRDGASGVDEKELATFRLAWGRVTRTHQLMACLAAVEILAAHPRVDATRIGATGVSLGGWLSVQTALCSERIAAVADFGRKTVAVPAGTEPGDFRGMGDLCHIIPGMAAVCDRNLLTLLYCPRPMLAGHGRKDAGSHREGPVSYQRLFARQYQALGKGDQYHYHIHDGGDTMPDQVVIDYFRDVFAMPPAKKENK